MWRMFWDININPDGSIGMHLRYPLILLDIPILLDESGVRFAAGSTW